MARRFQFRLLTAFVLTAVVCLVGLGQHPAESIVIVLLAALLVGSRWPFDWNDRRIR